MIKDLNNVTVLESLGVTVFSMVLVFVTLLTISYLIDLLRITLSKKDKKKNANKKTELAPATQVANTKPSVAIEDDTEVIAVIAAAIAAISESSHKGLIVRNIKKLPDNDSTWSRTGKIELMR